MIKVFFFYLLFFFSLNSFAQSNDYQQSMTLGESASTNRQYAQAIRHFGQAIKLKPSSPEAYLKQMEAAIQKRDLSVFKRTIQQLDGLEYSLTLDIYITYAQLAKKQRLYSDGLTMLNKAELKHKKNKSILLHRAAIYEKLNNNLEVINCLNEALKLDPKSLNVLHQLAIIYIKTNTKKSVELFKKLLKSPQYTDSALSSLGLLYTKLYETDPTKNRADLMEALNYYKLYSKRHPKDQDILALTKSIQILLD
jgi:tetratricopeptide (TPR) repeat protein